MADIKIEYNGEYPNLCRGTLIVYVDGERYNFGKNVLMSGGSCYVDDNYDEVVESGQWIVTFPENFPEEYKYDVETKINEEIEYGCCGGCL